MNVIYDNKKYERTTRRLRIIGFVLLIVGITLIVTSILSIADALAKEKTPIGFFVLFFLAFPTVFFAIVFLITGYRKTMLEYGLQATAPVAKDAVNYMFAETSDSFANMTGKVSKSIKNNHNKMIKCPFCGALNEEGSRYCEKCGSKLPLENNYDDYF